MESKKHKLKRRICLLMAVCTVFFSSPQKVQSEIKSSKEYYSDEEYEILANYSCSNGKEIVISKSFSQDYVRENSDNTIFVVDSRYDKDPDMVICDSYKVIDLKTMREILTILKEYENNNPTEWDRSIDSMINEWVIHNLGYYFGYKRESTIDTDLNNSDEESYVIKLR